MVRSTAYALLINSPFVRQLHPGNLVIPIAAIYHAQKELKHQYDKNLQVFHITQVVERAIIHKLLLTVEARYITAIRNRTTGQFIGTLFMFIQYMIFTCGKISPSQLIDLDYNQK